MDEPTNGKPNPYTITITRTTDNGRPWPFPPVTVTARSVRGALIAALNTPARHWQGRNR